MLMVIPGSLPGILINDDAALNNEQQTLVCAREAHGRRLSAPAAGDLKLGTLHLHKE